MIPLILILVVVIVAWLVTQYVLPPLGAPPVVNALVWIIAVLVIVIRAGLV